jgi:Protein of unknown function (DUF2442)
MMRQPRISAVAASAQPLNLAITWADGTTSIADLTDLVREFKVFEPLDDPATFANVRADERGWSIRWSDDIDIGADTLWRLALEQRGEAMRASDFNAWRERNGLSLTATAATLGLSRRVVAYYAQGRRIIPKIVLLATQACDLSQRRHPGVSVMLDVNVITAFTASQTLLDAGAGGSATHARRRKTPMRVSSFMATSPNYEPRIW